MSSAAAHDAPHRQISASLLRLRMHSPFVATLGLLTRFVPSENASPLGTDGRTIYYHPSALAVLEPRERVTWLVHQLLHAVLQHTARRSGRDVARWNLAADIVVEGLLAGEYYLYSPPAEHRPTALEQLPLEEVYEMLADVPSSAARPSCFASVGEATGAEARALADHWADALALAEQARQRSGDRAGPPKWAEPLLGRAAPALSVPDGVEALLAGEGADVCFPEEPFERFELITALIERTTSAEQAASTLRWLSGRAAPEWVQLWGSNILVQLRARGELCGFAEAVKQAPELQAFLRDYDRLLRQ